MKHYDVGIFHIMIENILFGINANNLINLESFVLNSNQ